MDTKDSYFWKFLMRIENEMTKEDVLASINNVVKFRCERSFHNRYSIKIEWKENDRFGIYVFNMVPKRLFLDEDLIHYEKQINLPKIDELVQIIEKRGYFDDHEEKRRFGRDGSDWKIEVKLNGKYKKIEEWSPKKGVVYDIGKYLIDLSDKNLEPIY